MSEGCGIYGLPRTLVNFLRQMEKRKDCLKWNINEGPHKLTLTMTWNFNRERISFVDRMKRTLGLNGTWSQQERIEVPKRSRSFVKRGQGSPERRCPFCSKALPIEKDKNPPGSPWNIIKNSNIVRSSFRRSSVKAIKDANLNRSLSFRDSSRRSSFPCSRSQILTSTPKNHVMDRPTSDIFNMQDFSSNSSAKNVRLAYRTVEDIELSYEDLFQKAKEKNSRQLQSLRREWDESIRKFSRRRYSSSSSTTSSLNDVITENGDAPRDVMHSNGQRPDNTPTERNAPAPPVSELHRRGEVPQGPPQNQGDIPHNGILTHQKTRITKCSVSWARPSPQLSYSTDII